MQLASPVASVTEDEMVDRSNTRPVEEGVIRDLRDRQSYGAYLRLDRL